jgi:SAM-dependent methyltransferase
MSTKVSIQQSPVDLNTIMPYLFLALLGKRVIHPGGRPATEEMYRLAQFQAGQRVLEVGCGVGTTAIEMARRFNCHVTAIDIDHMMLNRARANVHSAGLDGQVVVEEADVLALPYSDQTFDRVIIETVLGFVDKRRGAGEVVRVCRDSGRIVDHEFKWEEEPTNELRDTFEQVICRHSHFGDWSQIYKDAGLSDIEVVSGIPNVLSPSGLLRDEGLGNSLAIVGRALSHPSYLLKLVKLMKHMREFYPYLRWTIVGGVKVA